MKNYGIPIMFLGGGGYTLKNVARCWTYETSIIADTEVENDLPYNDYIEYFRPDFKLRPQIINSRVRQLLVYFSRKIFLATFRGPDLEKNFINMQFISRASLRQL